MISYKERLPQIKTIILDVDGVLTTGEVHLFQGQFVRTLHSKDGYVLHYASKIGYDIFVITGGTSEEVKLRLEESGVKRVCLRSANKMNVYSALQAEFGFKDEEVCYMGDDIPDIPLLKHVGFSACPQDASPDVKAVCHYQSPIHGGKGCVRDVIEQILRVQGNWMREEAFLW